MTRRRRHAETQTRRRRSALLPSRPSAASNAAAVSPVACLGSKDSSYMGKRLEQQPMYPQYTYYYPHYLQTKVGAPPLPPAPTTTTTQTPLIRRVEMGFDG